MPIVVFNCLHCDEQQFQTLSCVHYSIFSEVKLDFFRTSTVTGSHSCSGKSFAYASRTSCLLYYYIVSVIMLRIDPIDMNQYNHQISKFRTQQSISIKSILLVRTLKIRLENNQVDISINYCFEQSSRPCHLYHSIVIGLQ